MQLPIANGAYESDSLPISHQECVNAYANIVQTQGLSQETLFPTPGISEIDDTEGGFADRCFGAHVMAGVPYWVLGTNLYKLTRSGAPNSYTYALSDLGSVGASARVSMADNGDQLVVLNPGGNGYTYTASTDTLAQITDGDFTANGNPLYVVYIDGYFLFATDSKKFIISALNDGTSYNALDFGTAAADPDDIVAPIVFNNELYIAGSETFEGFQNQPNGADFPFIRTGLYIPKGCSAPFSLIPVNNTFFWIGAGVNESPAIWMFTGSGAQKVSTTAIDTILQKYSDSEIADAYAWSYAQKGAYFVGFSLVNETLVYDTISGRWHERKSVVTSASGTKVEEKWRPTHVVQAYGLVLVGDSKDGRVGALSVDTYTEYGENIRRRFSTQPFYSQLQSFSVPSMELTVESGVGDFTTTDPVVVMQISRDARTWTDGRTRRLGKQGDYKHRVIWRRNGRIPRFTVLRFIITDPIKFSAIRLDAEIV